MRHVKGRKGGIYRGGGRHTEKERGDESMRERGE